MRFDIRRDLAPGGELDDAAAQEYIDTLFGRFIDSPEARALPQADEDLGWALSQMRLGIDHLGATPPETSPADLDEIVFEIFPRKVTVQAAEAPAIVQELEAFWCFLDREFQLANAKACLELLGASAVSRLEAELSDPANFGPAKQFASFSLEAGFDLDTEAGMAEAMLAYNASLSASRAPYADSIGTELGPSSQPAPRGPARSRSRQKARRRAAKASRRKNRKRK